MAQRIKTLNTKKCRRILSGLIFKDMGLGTAGIARGTSFPDCDERPKTYERVHDPGSQVINPIERAMFRLYPLQDRRMSVRGKSSY
jgi:hypothetical protein